MVLTLGIIIDRRPKERPKKKADKQVFVRIITIIIYRAEYYGHTRGYPSIGTRRVGLSPKGIIVIFLSLPLDILKNQRLEE